jgi:dihydropteroate synthase
VNSQQLSEWCHQYDGTFVSTKSLSATPKPLIMGVLNVTPNSFSDGGAYLHLQKALERVRTMIDEGADIIDVGGEASNPYGEYESISVDEELARIVPIIAGIREMSDVSISVDTCKAAVMSAAVAAGASMINDIMALRADNALLAAATLNVPVCLMHMRGLPDTMQLNPTYLDGVMNEIHLFFAERIDACKQAGIAEQHIMLDPGLGFGKTSSHNLQILKDLHQFKIYRRPLLLGASRKGFIGQVLNKPVSERLTGGIVVAIDAVLKGVGIIRTHDVAETKQALLMLGAIQYPEMVGVGI